jgi:hypothetical protein
MHRIFILSPAKTSGKRASLIMNERAEFDLANRLRHGKVTLGEVFSFLSGLYFRGKYTYSQHFGRPPAELESQYVITSDAGLVSANQLISLARLRVFGEVDIDPAEPRYAGPLLSTCQTLRRQLADNCQIVLLGSIATNKYVHALAEVFGENLMIPLDFIGRGDMSRGGLLVRSVEADQELEYVALSDVPSRKGPRPPKLPPQAKSRQNSRHELEGEKK